MIGEAFREDSDQVCGAVVQLRTKGDKLAVWTKYADKTESVMTIGYVMEKRSFISYRIIIMKSVSEGK